MSTKTADRSRSDFRFGRRCDAAEEGRHFPSYLELLMGMPFFCGLMQDDVDEFVRRALPTLNATGSASSLHDKLDALTCRPTLAAFKAATLACQSETTVPSAVRDEWSVRLELYAAAMGCLESAVQTALEAISLSGNEAHRANGESSRLISQALGWVATIESHFDSPEARVRSVWETGEKLISRIVEDRSPADQAAADGDASADGLPFWVRPQSPAPPTSRLGGSEDVSENDRQTAVVFTAVGNQHTQEGKRVTTEWRSLIGRPLPLIPVPDLAKVRNALLDRFPFAAETIDRLLTELSGRACVALRPTILLGDPGVGKNHFAEAFLRELGIPSWTYPCGGVSDSSLAGTSRRWSSGEPSLITSLIRQHDCASPGVVLDEIEKVGSSKNGGNLLDALLGMLEPQTARAWMDPYLQAPVDLTHVIWLATSNDVSGLPAPLRDRCRVMPFPRPGPEHLPVLARNLLAQAIRDRHHDPRWAAPLTGEELECLGRLWSGGSLRRLRRLIDGVIAVRERDFTVQ